MKKTKLELTWIGKDKRPKLEPRILLEDTEKSYHASQRFSEDDIFDNRLIFGDNLLALKALEQEFTGKVKCIYIDPPYNTGNAFEHYDDGLEHSIWLGLMRDRLDILKSLLSNDGLIFVQIDDKEMAYLTILMDEVFGRENRINIISVKMSEASGVKMAHADKRLPKLKEYILVYKKYDSPELDVEKVPLEAWNDEYKTILLNIEEDDVKKLKKIMAQEICDENDVYACNKILENASTESLSQYFRRLSIPLNKQNEFKFDNAWRIIQAVGSSSVLNLAKAQEKKNQEIGAVLSNTGLIYLYKTDFDNTAKSPRIQIIFADESLLRNPGDFWTDIKTTGGVGQEGGVLFPNGKKPEALIKRIIGMCTKPGDLVLDSFAGSGTTGAVAHKMGRRWIMVELGEHCHTHIIPRLQKVIDGTDQGGISTAVNWQGGGGFRYYRLAPTLIVNDKWDNPIINPDYNPAMLAEAIAKLEGFTYQPSETLWWQHGYSTERDFIYVTTQTLSADQLQALSEEVGADRTLLICCAAYRGVTADKATERFPNLTIKKIPKMVLERCEWGHDDYSLNIANLPIAEPDISPPTQPPKKTKKSPAKKQAKPTAQQNGLFDDDPSESEQQGNESKQQGGQP